MPFMSLHSPRRWWRRCSALSSVPSRCGFVPFFVIVTLCFAESTALIANTDRSDQNGRWKSPASKSRVGDRGRRAQQKMAYYYVGVLLAAVSLFVSVSLCYSNIGRAAIAVRENRFVAQSIGISTGSTSARAFVLAAELPAWRAASTPTTSPLSVQKYWLLFMISMSSWCSREQGTLVWPVVAQLLWF